MKAHKTSLSVRELHKPIGQWNSRKAVGTDVGDDCLHDRGCGLSRGEFL